MKFEKNDTIAIAGGITLTWISLIASYRLNPKFSKTSWGMDLENPETIFATGGFPLKAYDYPAPPLGPGPEQSELPFIGNLLFWIILCYGILWFFRKQKLSSLFAGFTTFAAILTTMAGLLYLVLKFD